MTPYTRNMTQEATYWAPAANDGFGGKAFAAPVQIMCRWEDAVNLVRASDGREVTSNSTVYVNQVVESRGYLCLGNQMYVDDPTTLEGASEIIQVKNTPNLRGVIQLTAAYV